MSDQEKNREQLLQEIIELRRQVADSTAGPLPSRERRERQQQINSQVREQVWKMRGVEDIEQVLATVGESLRSMEIPFLYCGVNLVDTEARSATSLYTMNPQGEWQKKSFSGGPLIVQFWEGQKPVYRRDLHREDLYGEHIATGRIRSVVDVPFSHGTLAVSSYDPEAFSEADLEVLQDMAELLSEGFRRMSDLRVLEQRNLALEREVRERKRAQEQQQARYQVREQVWGMKSTDDIEGVLEAVGKELLAMEVPFRYCGVNLMDTETGTATSLYTMNPQGEWRPGPISGGPLIAQFWEMQEPVYRRDLHREDPYGEGVRIGRVRSVVDVPFSHGTLAVSSEEPEVFSDGDLEVLKDMAGILSEGFRRLGDLRALERHNLELEIEVGERRRAEEQIRASLREKEVLLKEIHHRVKNNLQIVSSLLSLQTRYIEDEEVVSSLNDSRTRVESMALGHEKLYQSEDLAQIDFGEYIHTLASYVFDSFESVPQAVRLRVEADPIPMDVDVAIPCGLIVNELITNSLKYAFADRPGGEICIELHPCGEGEVRLRIGDDGVGFPPEIDFRRTDSLGMQLVVDLTGQLEGDVQLIEGQGTIFEIVFPLPDSGKGNA
ncbi:MAG: hypothetical protein HOC74_43085 [Gemmatimonadetes bacterium]|nr:hypothetical protein [Gemmatimonadota bacterium]